MIACDRCANFEPHQAVQANVSVEIGPFVGVAHEHFSLCKAHTDELISEFFGKTNSKLEKAEK